MRCANQECCDCADRRLVPRHPGQPTNLSCPSRRRAETTQYLGDSHRRPATGHSALHASNETLVPARQDLRQRVRDHSRLLSVTGEHPDGALRAQSPCNHRSGCQSPGRRARGADDGSTNFAPSRLPHCGVREVSEQLGSKSITLGLGQVGDLCSLGARWLSRRNMERERKHPSDRSLLDDLPGKASYTFLRGPRGGRPASLVPLPRDRRAPLPLRCPTSIPQVADRSVAG